MLLVLITDMLQDFLHVLRYKMEAGDMRQQRMTLLVSMNTSVVSDSDRRRTKWLAIVPR